MPLYITWWYMYLIVCTSAAHKARSKGIIFVQRTACVVCVLSSYSTYCTYGEVLHCHRLLCYLWIALRQHSYSATSLCWPIIIYKHDITEQTVWIGTTSRHRSHHRHAPWVSLGFGKRSTAHCQLKAVQESTWKTLKDNSIRLSDYNNTLMKDIFQLGILWAEVNCSDVYALNIHWDYNTINDSVWCLVLQ